MVGARLTSHYIVKPPTQFKEMSYHRTMRSSLRVRRYLLVALLVFSHLAFASHWTLHSSAKPAGCNWCLCQGHAPAAPAPAGEMPIVACEAVAASAPETPTLIPSIVASAHQARAPPSVP